MVGITPVRARTTGRASENPSKVSAVKTPFPPCKFSVPVFSCWGNFPTRAPAIKLCQHATTLHHNWCAEARSPLRATSLDSCAFARLFLAKSSRSSAIIFGGRFTNFRAGAEGWAHESGSFYIVKGHVRGLEKKNQSTYFSLIVRVFCGSDASLFLICGSFFPRCVIFFRHGCGHHKVQGKVVILHRLW